MVCTESISLAPQAQSCGVCTRNTAQEGKQQVFVEAKQASRVRGMAGTAQ